MAEAIVIRPGNFCSIPTCGEELGTMAARARGTCSRCDKALRMKARSDAIESAEAAEAAAEAMEWPNGLEGVETWQLVDELFKRGWTASERVRNSKKRLILRAPGKYNPQSTRRS